MRSARVQTPIPSWSRGSSTRASSHRAKLVRSVWVPVKMTGTPSDSSLSARVRNRDFDHPLAEPWFPGCNTTADDPGTDAKLILPCPSLDNPVSPSNPQALEMPMPPARQGDATTASLEAIREWVDCDDCATTAGWPKSVPPNADLWPHAIALWPRLQRASTSAREMQKPPHPNHQKGQLWLRLKHPPLPKCERHPPNSIG